LVELTVEAIAEAMQAEVAQAGEPGHPDRAVIDSREARRGDLFFGLTGANSDGGGFAAAAIEAGAWGVVVERSRAAELAASSAGWVFAADNALLALQRLARAWLTARQCG
jgi:UDP-N-acetylmuramoyl-tripeptide--D-alanyl-D-alanine ligase